MGTFSLWFNIVVIVSIFWKNRNAMGWYLRKSIGFGPFRVNLSKSGIGYSFGVRGARIGANSRGTYIRMGRGAVYYQKYLQTNPGGPRSEPAPLQPQPATDQELAEVIHTASASSLQDSNANELLHELTVHYRKQRIAPFILVLTGLAMGFAMVASAPVWLELSLLVAGIIAHALATRADYRRKVVHLDYALEPDAARSYVALLQGIEQLRASGGLWRISSEEMNADTKYHAGAQYSIKRTSVSAKLEPPPFVTTDTAVLMLNTGSQRLYFLPDRILVYQGDQIGAVQYGSVNCSVQSSTFVENETVPLDAEIIGRTWRYTNKSGGPDRRFANNPEIPLVRYAEIKVQSSGGLNYLLQASNLKKAEAFIQAVKEYGAHSAFASQVPSPN